MSLVGAKLSNFTLYYYNKCPHSRDFLQSIKNNETVSNVLDLVDVADLYYSEKGIPVEITAIPALKIETRQNNGQFTTKFLIGNDVFHWSERFGKNVRESNQSVNKLGGISIEGDNKWKTLIQNASRR